MSPASITTCSAATATSPPTGSSPGIFWRFARRCATTARENREFLARAVTWAARQGIAQFADLGTGIPAHPSIGDAARTAAPDARIVYVDNDLDVTDHLDARLADDDG